MFSRSIRVAAGARTSFFLKAGQCSMARMDHSLLYPLACGRTLGLPPPFGCCERCCRGVQVPSVVGNAGSSPSFPSMRPLLWPWRGSFMCSSCALLKTQGDRPLWGAPDPGAEQLCSLRHSALQTRAPLASLDSWCVLCPGSPDSLSSCSVPVPRPISSSWAAGWGTGSPHSPLLPA